MATWTIEQLASALKTRGWLIKQREIQHAIQFDVKGGVKINLYTTGKWTFGGPKSAFKSEVEAFVDAGPR